MWALCFVFTFSDQQQLQKEQGGNKQMHFFPGKCGILFSLPTYFQEKVLGFLEKVVGCIFLSLHISLEQIKARGRSKCQSKYQKKSSQTPRCASRKAHKLTSWQDDKRTGWQDDKRTEWQEDKRTRWQDDTCNPRDGRNANQNIRRKTVKGNFYPTFIKVHIINWRIQYRNLKIIIYNFCPIIWSSRPNQTIMIL